jgi:hypothetical protein
LSCAARGVARQLLRGLPYLRAGAIEVLVFFATGRVAGFAETRFLVLGVGVDLSPPRTGW